MKDFYFSREALKKICESEYLTDKEKEALHLYYRRGMPQIECAVEMDISRGTFQKILNSARYAVIENLNLIMN